YLLKDLRLRLPAVDRQAEGGFCQEGVAADRLERGASGVGIQLIVSRHHPDFAPMLQPHLGRPQDVACRMERNVHSVERYRFAIGNSVDSGVLPEPGAEQTLAGLSGD